jgi:hypothetical protein
MDHDYEMSKIFGTVKVSSGPFDANNHNMINLADPVNTLDATNKQYVDSFRLLGDIKIFSSIK